MTQIVPQPGIMDIALYQGGKSHLAGAADVLKLSSNENPLGPSPAAKQAIAAQVDLLHRYPSTDHAALRLAIGEIHGLDPNRIICGVGSDELPQFVTQAYAGPGDEIIHTEHGFSMYPILARMAGATPVCVPEKDRIVDVDAVLDAVTARTRVVLIANPGNPTGTIVDDADLVRLADDLPSNVVLVLDGAYTEFAEGYDGGEFLLTQAFEMLAGDKRGTTGDLAYMPGCFAISVRNSSFVRNVFNRSTRSSRPGAALPSAASPERTRRSFQTICSCFRSNNNSS